MKWLTLEKMNHLTYYIRNGLTLRDSKILSKVSTDMLNDYIKANPAFEEELHIAEMQFKELHLNNIMRAAVNGDWRASAWMLAKRFRMEYSDSPTAQNLIQINSTSPPEVSISAVQCLIEQLQVQPKTIDVEDKDDE